MSRRAKKASPEAKKNPHYMVIAAFCGICLVAVLYTLFSPKTKFSQLQVIDDSQILVHNGQGHQFKHGKNQFFMNKTIADVKYVFTSALSDTNQISPCKSSAKMEEGAEEEKIDVPDSYDWRKVYPKCVQPVQSIGVDRNCSASFTFATLSAVQDRICMATNKTVQLSS